MPFLQDLLTVGKQVGSNLFGDLKLQYEEAALKSAETGDSQPLIKFYNKNEGELSQKYGISLNQILNVSPQTQEILNEMGTPLETLAETNTDLDSKKSVFTRIVLPILGIIAGGAAVIILFNTLKK